MKKRTIALALCMSLLLSACTVKDASTGGKASDGDTAKNQQESKERTSKESDLESDEAGLQPYEDTVTVHLGAGIAATTTFPEGQTMEDNFWLDRIKADLNLDIVYDWVCSDSDFTQKMNLAIASDTIPDMAIVNETLYRSMLKYGQIQDLKASYDTYASDFLKHVISSGGEGVLSLVEEAEGEMMAIPVPNTTYNGADVMWIRQDWLDAIDLKAPETLEDLRNVAEAFKLQDPDGNGADDTIGIAGPASSDKVAALGGNPAGFDPIFAAFKSFPEYWLWDEEGKIYYGSVQPETKDALAYLQDMYSNGLIDPEMLTRSDNTETLLSGKCGLVFAPTWLPYNLTSSIMSGADWQAYMSPKTEDGSLYCSFAPAVSSYVVVSKNCRYPEAAIKLINLFCEKGSEWTAENNDAGLDADAYPLFAVYDNADTVKFGIDNRNKYSKGEITLDDIDLTNRKESKDDYEIYKELKLEPYDNFSIKYWNFESDLAETYIPGFISSMVGEDILYNNEYTEIYSAYTGSTDTMDGKWSILSTMEQEAFAKIIIGQEDLDYFDEFVEKWYAQGGQDIINEIQDILNN